MEITIVDVQRFKHKEKFNMKEIVITKLDHN
jgi:hypothetical protein